MKSLAVVGIKTGGGALIVFETSSGFHPASNKKANKKANNKGASGLHCNTGIHIYSFLLWFFYGLGTM